MWPIYQTDTSMETGNCIQYAVASLLELQPEDVPRFDPIDWMTDTIHFFNSRGYQIMPGIKVNYPLGEQIILELSRVMSRFYCLLGVASFQDARKGHAVVGEWAPFGFPHVIHDPNPNNKDRRQGEYIIKDVDVIIPASVAAQMPLMREVPYVKS